MKILVVNAFGLFSSDPCLTKSINSVHTINCKKSKDNGFVVFCRLIAKALEQINVVLGYKAPIPPQCHIVSADNLNGIIVDWDNEILDDNSRSAALLFDSFDCVFIGSSTRKILPWDAKLAPLGKLMQMCNQTQKPCFTSGFCALLEIYVAALHGRRIGILNSYRGSALEKLPTFPVWAKRQGFLDNETGDIYTWGNNSEWRPSCNIGIRIVSDSGEPTSARLAPRERSFAADQRMSKSNLDLTTCVIECDGDAIVRINHCFLHHPAVAGLPPNFMLTRLPEWMVHRSGHLPRTLNVIGESNTCPMLLLHQNKTILCAGTAEGKHHQSVQHLMSNFVRHSAKLMFDAHETGNRIHSLLSVFLFGSKDQPAGFSRLSLAPNFPAIATHSVKSILPNGPRNIDDRISQPPDWNQALTMSQASISDTSITQHPQNTDACAFTFREDTMRGNAAGPATPADMSQGKGPLVHRPMRRAMLLETAGYTDEETYLTMASACKDIDDSSLKRDGGSVVSSMQESIISPIRAPRRPPVPALSLSGWSAKTEKSADSSMRTSISQTERIHREIAINYLPTAHPATSRESVIDPSRSFVSSYSSFGNSSKIADSKSSIAIVSPSTSKPYSTFKKFRALAASPSKSPSETPDGSYIGQYKTGPYMSAREREMKERHADRKKFLVLHPKGFRFGSPRHVIPLRAEGHLNGDGTYPERPRNQGFEHMTAADFEILRCENRAKHIAGHWKKF